jgi:hypothetical protein
MTWATAGVAAIGAAPSIMDGLFGGSSSSSSSQSVDPFKTSSGLGSTNFDGANSTSTLDPRFLQAQNNFLGQSGDSLGQLGAFGNSPFQQSQPFNLQQTTQDQYNLLESMQANARQEQTMGLEERLFNQGRLGSTGGIAQQRGLQDSIGQQQTANMNSAFGQGLFGQQQQFNQDLGVSQQRNNQQQLLASLSQGLFGSAMAPEQMLLNQMQVGGAFAPQSSESESSDDGWF